MPVLIVFLGTYLELRQLRTALTIHCLALGVLLRNQALNLEFTELQRCLKTKQRLRSAYQRRVQIHRHITCLNRLNDIILLAFVCQFEILLVERERSLRVIVKVEIQARSHLTVHVHLNLLVKVKDIIIPRFLRQRRVIDILMLKAKQQLRTSLQFQLHATRTEHFIRRTDIELHVRNIEFPLVIMFDFAYFLLPVTVHQLAFGIVLIFLFIKQIRCRNIRVAYLCVNDISTCHRVIHHFRLHVAQALSTHRIHDSRILRSCQFCAVRSSHVATRCTN